MRKINVLLLTPLEPSQLSRIQAVSPALNVIEAGHLIPPFGPADRRIEPRKERELTLLLQATEIVLGMIFPPDLIARSPRLKWIQTIAAGVERSLTPEIAASNVVMTNVSGMHIVPIRELVFGLILSHTKNLVQLTFKQADRHWERVPSQVLAGKTLGILGLGNIGRGIARLAKAFGMRVVATRRHVRRIERARDVDAVYPRRQLETLLGESDFIVDCLPYTPETAKYIGEAELKAMKPTAFFINIGRGKTVDETALIKALEQKWIAGAGLDTVENEPLSPDSPLWTLPGVIITPHISGFTENYMDAATAIFCDNLQRYLAGKRLKNIVDKKLGY